MQDYGYLDVLINEVKELRSKTNFRKIDISKCGISYMPTKKTSFVGLKQGYSDYMIKMQNGMKKILLLKNIWYRENKSYMKHIPRTQMGK